MTSYGRYWLLALFAAIATAAAAGEKTTLVFSEAGVRYEIPPVRIGSQTLTIVRESEGEIRYSSPYGRRDSLCHLRIGGNTSSIGRRFDSYADFAGLKSAIDINGFGSPDAVGSKIHEDRTSLVFSQRWRENNIDVFSVVAFTTANDIPLFLIAVIRDKANSQRERELEKGFTEWTARVAAVNGKLPQKISVVRGHHTIDIPFPWGYDRYVATNGEADDGWFVSFKAPRNIDDDGSVAMFYLPRFGNLGDKTNSPQAFRTLRQTIEEANEFTLYEISVVEEGKKHFIVRMKRPGRVDMHVAFIFIKSRTLALAFTPSRGGNDNPVALLNGWRRDTFKENLELPE